MKFYDLIIVGAGPIGMCCAIEAERHNLNYLVLEKGMLVNSIFKFPTNMTFFSTSKLLEIGEVPFIAHGEKPTRREALEYFRRVQEKWGLRVNYYEPVKGIEKQGDLFEVKTKKGIYTSGNVVIATGFYGIPHKMNVPGEDLPKVKHYYDEPHPYVDQRVVVVGAANSACDVALELYHKGADVTMVIRGDRINDRVKYWIKPNIENRIKEGSIDAYFNSTIRAIYEHSVEIDTPEGTITLENDFVLAMTGYEPDFSLLEGAGIDFRQENREPKYNDETHETNVAGLYVAGVVCGGMKTNKFFIENARDHAEKIVLNILQKASVQKV